MKYLTFPIYEVEGIKRSKEVPNSCAPTRGSLKFWKELFRPFGNWNY